MVLSDDDKQRIRDEEFFRAEVRAEAQQHKPPPGWGDRLSGFFETKAGFWLLTTVLAGIAATALTSLQHFMDRKKIETAERADRARRDTDTMLKLGPLLTSEKRTQVDMALVLLDGLASDEAVDRRIVVQVRSLFERTIATGTRSDATPQEQAQADAVLAYVDRARVQDIQGGAPPPAPQDSPASSAAPGAPAAPSQPAINQAVSQTAGIDDRALPTRVYIQVGGPQDRVRAQALSAALRGAGIVVPGIEDVGARRAPPRNDVRFCEAKSDAAVREQVKAALDPVLKPTAVWVALAPSLCTRVRYNHMEVWLARSASS